MKINGTLENIGVFGNNCFGSSGLSGRIVLSGKAKIIEGAFKGTDIEEVEIKEGTRKELKTQSFGVCDKLKAIKIGEGLEVIGRQTFFLDRHLRIVESPSTLKKIEASAFVGCRELKILDLSHTQVEHVEPSAFDAAEKVKVILPRRMLGRGYTAQYLGIGENRLEYRD